MPARAGTDDVSPCAGEALIAGSGADHFCVDLATAHLATPLPGSHPRLS
jgi:hypothetical protein